MSPRNSKEAEALAKLLKKGASEKGTAEEEGDETKARAVTSADVAAAANGNVAATSIPYDNAAASSGGGGGGGASSSIKAKTTSGSYIRRS